MELSLAESRRLVLAAQGFGRSPGKRSTADVRKVASKVHAIQVDSISVLVRSHYLPAYSRLGSYPMGAIDKLAYTRRELFECWGHATCLMPVHLYPLLRHRMTAQRTASPWTPGMPSPDGAYIEQVYNEVAERGPVAAGDVSNPGARGGKWWGWSNAKMALEHLLSCGLVAIAGRRGFTRLYDITERVIPQEALDAPAPEPEEAQKQLIRLSAQALGVATARQLGGYFGLHSHRIVVRGPDGKRPRPLWPRLVAELVEEGQLVPVDVEGWPEQCYMIQGTRMVRSVHERALLSPFDSFMWGSARLCCGFTQPLAQQLYVPAEKRVYGYYVLPFLLGDTLVGRVDLKADRRRGLLLVQGAFHEPGQNAKYVAAELAEELDRMRTWLELENIEVSERGNLAAMLCRSIQPRAQ